MLRNVATGDGCFRWDADSLATITGCAPGKLVLSGEYAVLLGAPALVLSVDRTASATLRINTADGWVVDSNVAKTAKYDDFEALLADESKGLLQSVVHTLPSAAKLPTHAHLTLDTRSFFYDGKKLGIGSSAAILVALAELLGHLTKQRISAAELINVHNALQASSGSGLDVMASRQGGLIRFQSGKTIQMSLPTELHMRFVFTQVSTSTQAMVSRFRQLIEAYSTTALSKWRKLATDVADATFDVSQFLECLATLNQFVLEFDRVTGLGIFSHHRTFLDVANHSGVLYKPCGAGGGDIGVALSDDASKLAAFERTATQKGLTILNLNVARHGASIQL